MATAATAATDAAGAATPATAGGSMVASAVGTAAAAAVTAGGYRGRLAPSPTGYLHMGHAKVWTGGLGFTLEWGGVTLERARVEGRDKVGGRRGEAQGLTP